MSYMVAPLLRTYWDWHVIENEKRGINYLYHNSVLVVLISVQIMVMVKWGGVNVYDAIVMAIAVGWGIFDFALNAFRNKSILSYYGDFEDKKNLSFIEKYVYSVVPWPVLLAAKLIFLAAAITVYG